MTKPKNARGSRLEAFKKHCENWQGILGLNDWHISYKVKRLDESSYAMIEYNASTRKADLYLNLYKNSDEDRERFAIHEMLHLVFADMTTRAECFYNLDKIAELEHAAINRIISALELLNRIK